MERNKNTIHTGIFTTDVSLSARLKTLIHNWENFCVLFTASNRLELAKNARKSPLHILLLDINIHREENCAFIQEMKNEWPETKIIIFSQKDHSYNIVQSFRAGAHGHIAKDIDSQTLNRALLRVHFTGSYYNEKLLSKSAAQNNFQGVAITEREQKMLQLLCSPHSLKEIAALTGHSRAIVEGYRKILLEKLKVPSREALIEKAGKLGIIPAQTLAE